MASTRFSKVSQWIAAGSSRAGFHLLEDVADESETAIGFDAHVTVSGGRSKLVVCWLPKSELIEVINDYYAIGPAVMFLVPGWLYRQKRGEGIEL